MNQKIILFMNQFERPQAINRPLVPVAKQLGFSGPKGQLLIKQTTEHVIMKFA